MLDAAMRRLGRDESLRPPLEVRKSRADGRMAWGTFRVPAEDATRWLRCSGRNGLLIRPFFTAATTEACAKERFEIHWLRTTGIVDADALNQLWENLKEIQGVFGLVLSSKDVGVRVDRTNAQTLTALEAALQGKSSQLRQKSTQGELVVPQEYGGRRPFQGGCHFGQVRCSTPRRVEKGEGWAFSLEDFFQGGVCPATPVFGRWVVGCLPTLDCGGPPASEGYPDSNPS